MHLSFIHIGLYLEGGAGPAAAKRGDGMISGTEHAPSTLCRSAGDPQNPSRSLAPPAERHLPFLPHCGRRLVSRVMFPQGALRR